MSAALISLFASFVLLLVLGVPIAFGIGVADLMSILAKANLPLTIIPQKLYTSIDSFSLLAIPLFIIAGDIMMKGGISKRLINLANAVLGWSKYCLAYVTVAASAFFAAISGSAPATNAAIGGMMYDEMTKNGFDPDFSAFLGAISGTLGPLIPPSIPIVIFATQNSGVSVKAMFSAAAVAGVILAIVYCLTAKFTLRKDTGIKVNSEKPTLRTFWLAFLDAIWGLISPLIILGGIYSGKFSATEAAVISVVYSLLIGFFVYKELTVKDVMESLLNSALTSGMVLILIGVASIFSWMLSVEGVGALLKGLVASAGLNKYAFLLIVTLIYLVLGCFIETIPIIILTSPIFFPIATGLGVDPVHFGILTVFNLVFGIITPPFGINLYVSAGYSKRDIFSMCRKGKYFFVAGIAMILVFTFLPQLYMWAV